MLNSRLMVALAVAGLNLEELGRTLEIDQARLLNWCTAPRDALEDNELAALVDFGMEAIEAYSLDVRQQVIDSMEQAGFNAQQQRNIADFLKRIGPLRKVR